MQNFISRRFHYCGKINTNKESCLSIEKKSKIKGHEEINYYLGISIKYNRSIRDLNRKLKNEKSVNEIKFMGS